MLVRPFTEADDVAGFHAARGILTSEGGKASHAALVARGMGRPCVCGAVGSSRSTWQPRELRVDGRVLGEGDLIAIDGTHGNGHRRTTCRSWTLSATSNFETVLEWADELRRLGVRANADTPEDAAEGARARSRGHRPVPDRAHVHGAPTASRRCGR